MPPDTRVNWFSITEATTPAPAEEVDQGEVAAELLRRFGPLTGDVGLIGTGETFLCYGTNELALLIPRHPGVAALERLRVAEQCSSAARARGVRTPEWLAVEEDPVPHAICERVAGRIVGAEPEERAKLFRALGEQLRLLHQVAVTGAGPAAASLDSGAIQGAASSWQAHCETFAARLLPDDPSADVARLRSFGTLDRGHWRLLRELVQEHGRRPVVLCHYDNRDPNLPILAEGVCLLDWDLARVAPASHELVKPEVDRAALLDGYGVSSTERAAALTDTRVAVMMEGVAMSMEWLADPRFHDGIRRWLDGIKGMLEEL